VVVDLGVPPNVAVARGGLRITRLAELTRDAASGTPPRAAERLVEEELQRFLRWRSARRRHAIAA
jgi:glutamyl-tRNA reductase